MKIGLAATVSLLGLAACARQSAGPTASPSEVAGVNQAQVDPSSTPQADAERTRQLMYDLSGRDRQVGQQALEAILQAEDSRFIPVLLEILRGAQIGMFLGIDADTAVTGLQQLSGETFGSNWAAWIEWYGGTDFTPPDGFTGWKGDLLAFIDPRFADFLRDGAPSTIRVEEILWGGVTVDGIPALDRAELISAEQAGYLLPDEPVFGVAINGDARAYPLRILDWHEMANDVVGGVPLSLAYCTLCGAAIAYDGRASNGVTYDFGSSGFLYRSNKLMYDRQTRTLWNQLTGEPVLGDLAGTDLRLELLPVVLTSWEAWRAQHPMTLVLALETGFERFYLPGAAYGHYFASDATMFPVWQRSEALEDKTRIYALRVDGTPKAYPLDLLTERRVVNDTVGATALVLVATRGRVTVDGTSLQIGQVTYDSGGEVRAFERGDRLFSPGASEDVVLDDSGRQWSVTEEGLISPDGELAPRYNGHLAYWFGWFAFFPNTLIYEVPNE